MVKPGGTGSPRLAISARLAPLPPNRSRRPALPSALPSPNVKTHLPDFTAGFEAGLLGGSFGAAFTTGFATVSGALFFSAWRALAGGAVFTRTGADGFDFAAIFLSFEAALAMTCINPREGGEVARLTPL